MRSLTACPRCNSEDRVKTLRTSRERDKIYTDWILECRQCGKINLILQEQRENKDD